MGVFVATATFKDVTFAGLDIILPVGISFYTFQTLSYTLDVYRGKLKPWHSFLDYALYVTFFPQLVAGPIERAGRLIPQFHEEKRFDWDGFTTGFLMISSRAPRPLGFMPDSRSTWNRSVTVFWPN